MLDIKFVRENADLVKENIKKKFQDAKLPLVDEAIALDEKIRGLKKSKKTLEVFQLTFLYGFKNIKGQILLCPLKCYFN